LAGQTQYQIVLDGEGRSLSAPIATNSQKSRGLSFSIKTPYDPNTKIYCEVRAVDSDPSQIAVLPQGKNVNLCDDLSKPVQITEKQGALFYYVVKKVPSRDPTMDESDDLTKLKAELGTLDGKCQGPSGQETNAAIKKVDCQSVNLKELQQIVVSTEQEIKETSDSMKAYAGMSTPAAAEGVTKLLEVLQTLQKGLKAKRQTLLEKQDYEAKKVEVGAQQNVVDGVKEAKWVGLRAGIVPFGEDKRPVYYRFVHSSNMEIPFRLERMEDFPVFTVKNDLYLVIMNHRQNDIPSDFQLTYGTEKGNVVDIAPLRPTIDQPTQMNILTVKQVDLFEDNKTRKVDFDKAYVDRVLPFANKLPGETILTVTVSSYAQVVTTNKEETGADGTVKTLIKETKTVRVLDGEKWPPIHSLFYFNLSTGLVATWLRDPAFSRVATVVAVPQNGDTPAVPAKYKTAEDRGSARAIPVLAFSGYLRGMDIQVPWRPRDLTPAPTVAFSLTDPSNDFFFGASSELRRNVQVIYGYHFGKVTRLGPQGVDDATSSIAPSTVKYFQGNLFLGLTFNVNFIKNLFAP